MALLLRILRTRRPRSRNQRSPVKQLPFEWVEEPDRDALPEIDLPAETIRSVVALMARVLIALVRPSEGGTDER